MWEKVIAATSSRLSGQENAPKLESTNSSSVLWLDTIIYIERTTLKLCQGATNGSFFATKQGRRRRKENWKI